MRVANQSITKTFMEVLRFFHLYDKTGSIIIVTNLAKEIH